MYLIRIILLFLVFFLLFRLIVRILFGFQHSSVNTSGKDHRFYRKKEGEIYIFVLEKQYKKNNNIWIKGKRFELYYNFTPFSRFNFYLCIIKKNNNIKFVFF